MENLELGHTQLILAACKRHDLLRNETAYVLATAYWETARTMEPVKEAYWLSEAWRKRNLRYYPWYGRGFVQLTWERNYIKAGKELGIDLTSDPDKVMDPEVSAEILVIGSKEGWFTGKKLSDYITLQKSNYVGARRIINGTDKAAEIAEIARQYEALLLADGYGVEIAPPEVIEPAPEPRSKPSQSTTLRAQVMQWITTGGAGLYAAWNAADDFTRYVIIGAVLLSALAGFWIFKERLRKWGNGDR